MSVLSPVRLVPRGSTRPTKRLLGLALPAPPPPCHPCVSFPFSPSPLPPPASPRSLFCCFGISTTITPPPPPPPSQSLGQYIVVLDDFHSLCVIHSSFNGTLVKAQHFHTFSQPSFLSNRVLSATSINNQGCVSTKTTKRTLETKVSIEPSLARLDKGDLNPFTLVQPKVVLSKICVWREGTTIAFSSERPDETESRYFGP